MIRKKKSEPKAMKYNHKLKTKITNKLMAHKTAISRKEEPLKNTAILYIAEIILLIVVGILGTILFRGGYLNSLIKIDSRRNSAGLPKVSPTPIPLRAGAETYKVSQSTHSGPAITSVNLQPLDVLKGQTFSISTDVSNLSDVTSVTGSLEMDSSKMDLVFERESGDEKNGTWKTEVLLTDSVFYVYTLTINAESANGINTIKVTPR